MTTVVLCASLGATCAMWDGQLPALEGHDVVAVDHPGHGGEPVSEVEDVAALARRVLARVDAERFTFVGLSLGASVGLRLALDAPDRVERLVACCTSAQFGPPAQWHERAAIVREQGLEAIVDAVLGRWFTPQFRDVGRFREMFLATDPEGYARCCEALAGSDLSAELPGIRAQTLCIAGSEDPTSPPGDLRAIAAAIPGARAEVLPDARHLAPVERADEANALLREFLT